PTRASVVGRTFWRTSPISPIPSATRAVFWPSISRPRAGGGASPRPAAPAGGAPSPPRRSMRWWRPRGGARGDTRTRRQAGASGRVRLLLVSGAEGATELRGELTIRKRFGMLNSALFTVTEERDEQGRPSAFVFRGGGWGHGVGMCQTGAIGRAESGQDYRAILRHYFNGAEVARIYEGTAELASRRHPVAPPRGWGGV